MCRDWAVASNNWGVVALFWIEKRNCLQEMSRDSEEMARDWTSFDLCLVTTRKVDTSSSNCLGFVVEPDPFASKVEDIAMSTSDETKRASLSSSKLAPPGRRAARRRRRARLQERRGGVRILRGAAASAGPPA